MTDINAKVGGVTPPLQPTNPAYNTYVGARYVPVFAGTPGSEWTDTVAYEPLTIVIHEGNSYTSKTFVPVGVDIGNGEYWALTGNYNAQVELYRQEVEKLKEIVGELDNLTNGLLFYPKTTGQQTLAQGFCVFVDQKKTFIFDCGNSENLSDNIALLTALKTSGVISNIDYITISHYHGDHVGCLGDILTKFPHDGVKVLIPLSPAGYLSEDTMQYDSIPTYINDVNTALANAGITPTIINGTYTEKYANGRTLSLYNSSEQSFGYYAVNSPTIYNNFSMVAEIKAGNVSALFPGDIQKIGEQYCIKHFQIKKQSFMQVNHHGLQHDDNMAFVQAVNPDVCMVQTNSYLLDRFGGSLIVSYTDCNAYCTAYAPGTFIIGENGCECVNGSRIFEVSNYYNYINFYIDNTKTVNGDGSQEKPFNSLKSALAKINNDRCCYYKLYFAASEKSYGDLYIRNFKCVIELQSINPENKAIFNFAFMEGCNNARLYNLKFTGRVAINNIYANAIFTNSPTGYMTGCELVAPANTNGILLDLSTLYLSNTKIQTENYSGVYGIRYSNVFTNGNTFIGCSNAISLANTDVHLGSTDTLTDTELYISSGEAGGVGGTLNVNPAMAERHTNNCAKNSDKVCSNIFHTATGPALFYGKQVLHLTSQ